MLSDEQACRGCSSRSTPDSAVEGGVLTEEQTFRSEDQCVSASEKATAVSAVHDGQANRVGLQGKTRFLELQCSRRFTRYQHVGRSHHGARFRRAVSDLCVLEPVRSLAPLSNEAFSRDIWLTAAHLDGAA